MEIFRKKAESQNNRKPKLYNHAAMKKKPQISYDAKLQHFIADGCIIGDDIARDLWDEGSCDWTQSAYQEMTRRVLS